MNLYWDSSALVPTVSDLELENRLVREGGYTRHHTLAEVFSALSGIMHIQFQPNHAAKAARAMVGQMEFVQLSEAEILDALDQAQARGARGGRVHDYLNALAADKAGAVGLLTMDRNDFVGLMPGLAVEQV